MSRQNCTNSNECLIVAIASSIVIGIVAAVLRITGIITLTPAFLWVVFGIAVGFLAIAFILSSLRRFNQYDNTNATVRTFIAGILGTILFSLILLGITFATTSAIGAVLTGLLLASFALIITTLACLILKSYNYED